MKIEASALRVADVVRLPSAGEREVRRVEIHGREIWAWFRRAEPEAEQDADAEPDNGPPPPDAVFDATDVLEIQRPGSLFEKVASVFRFKPPLAPRQRRIVDELVGLGWRFHQVEGQPDHLHDAIDMVRVEFQGDRVVLLVRERMAEGWTWPREGLVLGTLDDFDRGFDQQIAKLQTTSILAQWEREELEKPVQPAPVPDTRALPEPAPGTPVIVRYSESEGILLCGDTKPHKEIIGKLKRPFRFRYSKTLPTGCAWYVPRTRYTVHPREKLVELVEVLHARGVPVELDYVAPQSQTAEGVTPKVDPWSSGALRAVPSTSSSTSSTSTSADATSTSEPAKRGPGRPADRKAQAERLRGIARRILADADETIGQKRQENTHRRARMAAGIRKRAYGDQIIGGAMLLAADEVEAGRLTYVARLTSRPQIEDLETALGRARDERKRQIPGGELLLEGHEPELEDVAFARFRGVRVWPHNLRRYIELAGDRLTAAARRKLRPLADGPDQDIVLTEPADVDLVRPLAVPKGKPGYDLSMDVLAKQIAEYDRLARLGIHDTASLRAALREYLGCCRGSQKRRTEDPIAVKRRELQFANIPGYFPTPDALAQRMVELAELEPGMRVLEPSAGSGNIAMAIRREQPDLQRLDVIEWNATLRELLELQGLRVVASDFLAYAPDGVAYDRIIMNPPFEGRQDAQHIEHALGMLAPGGRLVAIASRSFESRTDGATARLREKIEGLGGTIERVPAGAFADSGTQVATVLIVVDAAAASVAARNPALPDDHRAAPRPALAVVPVELEQPAKEDCGCKHAEPEPEQAPARAAKPRKARASTSTSARAATPTRAAAVAVASVPMPASAVAAASVRTVAPVESTDAESGKIERVAIDLPALADLRSTPAIAADFDQARWDERARATPDPITSEPKWRNIDKTSCFELRDGDDSITLCPAFQVQPVGHCPPMKRVSPSFGLCQPGEPVEFFLRGTDNVGIRRAKAEGIARFGRARTRRAGAHDFDLTRLPVAHDFDAVLAYVDHLIPSRIVFDPAKPLEPRLVWPAQPLAYGPTGVELSIVDTVPPSARIEPAVTIGMGQIMSLAEFVAALHSGELVAYQGGASMGAIGRVLALGKREELTKQGVTVADVQAGKVDARTLYWLTTPDGVTLGPILANGDAPGKPLLEKFGKLFGRERTLRFPPGWDPSRSIAVAMSGRDGKWRDLAWHVDTHEFVMRFGTTWKPTSKQTEILPERSTWKREGGFTDFPRVVTHSMLGALAELPRTVRFRIGGAWLGRLWPSDFGGRIDFDPPTGGELDVDEIHRMIGELSTLAEEQRAMKDGYNFATKLDEWTDLERNRLRWTQKQISERERAAKRAEKAERAAAKPKRAAKPKPERVAKPKRATDKPKLAVVPATSDEETMSKKASKKASGKKAAEKKAAEKKAAEKKAAEKKAETSKAAGGKKKAAAKPKTASEKKASAAKPSKAASSKKAAAKPATAKPAATKVDKPMPAAAAAASPCDTTDDSCDLGSWRTRIKRGDRVRFRSNSRIAATLGIKPERVFEVRCTVCRDGQRYIVLDLGIGSANDVALPAGQFAVVERGPETIPEDVRDCVAKLARAGAKLPPELRRVVARLAGGG